VAVAAADAPREAARPAPAPAPAAASAGAAAPPAGRRVRVVLDAGHGGDDPGAIGFVVEKHVTLDLVRRLARRLREDLGAEVILTRSSDATIPLTERTAIANQAGADVFVSIHANANPGGRRKGIETYVLDDADDQATLRLAAIENGTSRERYRAAPTDLRYILSSLVQGGKMPDSSRLARAVQTELMSHMRVRYPDVEDLGVKRGPFYVLVGSHMPCILIETSFVSHPVEGRRLADEAYRVALADGVARGIRRFLAERRQARTL
jgi:N-acetylmuramoyl-L-alanine amidase